jgi:hypothetical protein
VITNYTTLQSEVADWLNRTDLTAVIPSFIQMAEVRFQRDKRCWKLQNRGTFSVSADGQSLPSDFVSLDSWYHDGPVYFGALEIVGADAIGALKGRFGETGVPRFAAIVDGVVRFAPEPDATYATAMTYWRKASSLSGSTPTNWLLAEHPDLYLYGALAEAAPYLKDDARVAVWKSELEARLNEVERATEAEHWGGNMRRRHRAIGG